MYQDIKGYYLKLLQELEEPEWELFEQKLEIHTFQKGQLITKAGEVENYVFYVRRGSARIYSKIGEKEISSHFFFENDYLSEYESFISRSPARCSIDALEDDTVLIGLNYNNLQSLYGTHRIYEKAGRLVAESLFVNLSARTASFLTQDPETRYLNLLKKNPQVQQRVPLYMIASYLGITPEALSRIRRRIVIPG